MITHHGYRCMKCEGKLVHEHGLYCLKRKENFEITTKIKLIDVKEIQPELNFSENSPEDVSQKEEKWIKRNLGIDK